VTPERIIFVSRGITVQHSAETLLILRIVQLDIRVHMPSCTVHISVSHLHDENPFGGSPVIPRGNEEREGRTDRHD